MNEGGDLTIAEAAAQIGVSERTLRRLLARPENAGKMRRERRQTKTGIRETCLLSATVVQELATVLTRLDETPANTGDKTAATTAAEHGNGGTNDGAATLAMLAIVHPALLVYERVVQEQAARIIDLQTALEHEREQSRRLQDALQREQTLRLLPAPTQATAANGGTEARQSAAADNLPEKPETASGEAQARPWWQFWKRER